MLRERSTDAKQNKNKNPIDSGTSLKRTRRTSKTVKELISHQEFLGLRNPRFLKMLGN